MAPKSMTALERPSLSKQVPLVEISVKPHARPGPHRCAERRLPLRGHGVRIEHAVQRGDRGARRGVSRWPAARRGSLHARARSAGRIDPLESRDERAPDRSPLGPDRGGRRSRSRLRASGRPTSATGSPRPGVPIASGVGMASGRCGASLGSHSVFSSPPARSPTRCAGVARPCRRRAGRWRCPFLRRGLARWEDPPNPETAPRAVGARGMRRWPLRRRALDRGDDLDDPMTRQLERHVRGEAERRPQLRSVHARA